MFASTQQFIDTLESQDHHYNLVEADQDHPHDMVGLLFGCDNLDLELNLFFGEDCEDVAIRGFDLVKIPEDKMPAALLAVNELNNRFRFVKFVVETEDAVIRLELDASFRRHDVGDICYELVMRTVNICDEAYPSLMKAVWS